MDDTKMRSMNMMHVVLAVVLVALIALPAAFGAEPPPLQAGEATSANAPQSVASAPGPRTNWETTPTSWSSGLYEYDGSGNVKRIGSDTFRYDPMGRLASATAGTASATATTNLQEFTYDRYGNLRTITGPSPGETLRTVRELAVNPATNRIDGTCVSNPQTCLMATYDPSGSGHQVGLDTPGQYVWDSLGMLIYMSHRGERYVYDATEERILTIDTDAGSTARYTLRGADKKVTRELTFVPGTDSWTLAKDYVYRGGIVAASFSTTQGTAVPDHHYHLDHLGTTRLVTDAGGQRLAAHTYWAFGLEAPGSDTDTERLKFTGHERDSSPDGFILDYMHARYYDPNLARFLTADPVLGETRRPQTWNRYSYANNNPMNVVDPTGMYEVACAADDLDCKLNAAYFEGARSQALASQDAATRAAAAAYGEPGEENGVAIVFGPTTNGTPAETYADTLWSMQMVVGPPGHDGTRHMGGGSVTPFSGVTVTFDGTAAITPANVGHEGVHVAHALNVFQSWDGTGFNRQSVTQYFTESAAYHVTASFATPNQQIVIQSAQGNYTFRHGMNQGQRQAVIDAILRDPSLPYNLTPSSQGGAWPP